MIEVNKYSELTKDVRDMLNFYIQHEFGDIPIVNETQWAKPDWTILLYEEGNIATFHNIVLANIQIDNKRFKVGGINNLITPEKFRGNGYAPQTLKDRRKSNFR